MFKLNCVHHAFTKKVFYFKHLKNAQKFAEKLERNYNRIQNRQHAKLAFVETEPGEFTAQGKYSAFYYISTIKTED